MMAVPSVSVFMVTAPLLEMLPLVMLPPVDRLPLFTVKVPSVNVLLDSIARPLKVPDANTAVPSVNDLDITIPLLEMLPLNTLPDVDKIPLRSIAVPSVNVPLERKTSPFKLPDARVTVPSVSDLVMTVPVLEMLPLDILPLVEMLPLWIVTVPSDMVLLIKAASPLKLPANIDAVPSVKVLAIILPLLETLPLETLPLVSK